MGTKRRFGKDRECLLLTSTGAGLLIELLIYAWAAFGVRVTRFLRSITCIDSALRLRQTGNNQGEKTTPAGDENIDYTADG